MMDPTKIALGLSLGAVFLAYLFLAGGMVPHDAFAHSRPKTGGRSASSSGENGEALPKEYTSQAGKNDPTTFDSGLFFAEWLSHGQTGADVSNVRFGPTERARIDANDEANHASIAQMGDLMGLGMAMRTARAVGMGENILCVPRTLIVDREVAMASLGLPVTSSAGAGGAAAAAVSDEAILALFVLREKALGNDSPWRPYTDTLPMNMGNMPAFWTESEKEELTLGASKVERDALLGGDALRGFQALSQLLDREGLLARFPGMNPGGAGSLSQTQEELSASFSQHNFLWAHAAVRARAFSSVPGLKPGSKALVAGLDTTAFTVASYMAQHQVLVDGGLVERGDDGTGRRADDVCVRASVALPPATPVVATYRGRPNFQLLSAFGIAFHPNADDAVPLHVRAPAAPAGRIAALRKLPGVEVLAGNIVRVMASPHWDLDTLAAPFRLVSAGERPDAETIARVVKCAGSKGSSLGAPSSPSCALTGAKETEAIELLKLTIRRRLKGAKKAVREGDDQRMVMGETPNRERIAISYHLGILDTIKAVKKIVDTHKS